jgi:hypothetical protein
VLERECHFLPCGIFDVLSTHKYKIWTRFSLHSHGSFGQVRLPHHSSNLGFYHGHSLCAFDILRQGALTATIIYTTSPPTDILLFREISSLHLPPISEYTRISRLLPPIYLPPVICALDWPFSCCKYHHPCASECILCRRCHKYGSTL